MWKLAVCSAFVFASSANASESEKKPSVKVEGAYKVQSIEKHSAHTIIRFEKYPEVKENKVVVLEVSELNHGLLRKEDVLEISAEVVDQGKGILEAEQVLLSLQRESGKMRVWLLSRKGKGVLNLQNTSYLKMHGSENDYLIL